MSDELRDLLNRVAAGEITPEDAAGQLRAARPARVADERLPPNRLPRQRPPSPSGTSPSAAAPCAW